MSEQYNIFLENEFYFSTKNSVPVSEIIRSLEGLDYTIKQTKKVLEKLSGSNIVDIELLIDELKSGSLLEKIVVKLGFGSEEEMDRCLEGLHSKMGKKISKNIIFGVTLTAIIAYAVYNAIKTETPTYSVTVADNVIINLGNESTLTSEQLYSIIDDSIKSKRKLSENVIKFISPARTDNESSLSLNDQEIIPSSLMNKIPTSIDSSPPKRELDYDNVVIEIRSIDLDNKNKGWNGLIPQLGINTRIKITLNDEIDAKSLYGKISFKANVEILYKLSSDQITYNPYEIYVKNIIN